jgi:hypothetical protein
MDGILRIGFLLSLPDRDDGTTIARFGTACSPITREATRSTNFPPDEIHGGYCHRRQYEQDIHGG